MNIILTFDYELFFGAKIGTVYNSIFDATNRLLSVLNKYAVKAVFFVDIGYINKLQKLKNEHPELRNDYNLIVKQLKDLAKEGHDLQLHIHPHWEDSTYKDGKWSIITDRYRLSEWPQPKIFDIVAGYKKELEKFSNGQEVFAYRAGGWCIQPFENIKEALKENNIWLDSTIFKGGFNNSRIQPFNFEKCPNFGSWRFDSDPLQVDNQGFFQEIPIASYRVPPSFFWKLAWTRITKKQKHQPFGDGIPLSPPKTWILKKLLCSSYSVVSVDGLKASYLQKAFLTNEKNSNDEDYFVVIGHPKSLTEYSLNSLDKFLNNYYNDHLFTTFNYLRINGKLIK